MTPFHRDDNSARDSGGQPISATPSGDASQGVRSDEIWFFSTPWCGDCRRSRRVFASLGIPFIDIDIEEDSEATALVMRLNRGMRSVPTILFPDGSVLVEPSPTELEAKLRQITVA